MILEDIKGFFDIEKNPKIIKKLPEMFYLAELENRKKNKLSPDIGNIRERILISIFEELFGKENVNDDLGPVEKEVDVEILKERYSIKTLTSKKPKGVKAVWTVDEGSVKKFVKKYKPTCSIIYVHINCIISVMDWEDSKFHCLIDKLCENLKEGKGTNFWDTYAIKKEFPDYKITPKAKDLGRDDDPYSYWKGEWR